MLENHLCRWHRIMTLLSCTVSWPRFPRIFWSSFVPFLYAQRRFRYRSSFIPLQLLCLVLIRTLCSNYRSRCQWHHCQLYIVVIIIVLCMRRPLEPNIILRSFSFSLYFFAHCHSTLSFTLSLPYYLLHLVTDKKKKLFKSFKIRWKKSKFVNPLTSIALNQFLLSLCLAAVLLLVIYAVCAVCDSLGVVFVWFLIIDSCHVGRFNFFLAFFLLEND